MDCQWKGAWDPSARTKLLLQQLPSNVPVPCASEPTTRLPFAWKLSDPSLSTALTDTVAEVSSPG